MLNSDQDLDINPHRQVAKSPSLQYPPIFTELSVERSKAMPIFAEATAQAARLTDAPVAILTTIYGLGDRISAIFGLEQFTRLPPNPNLPIEFSGLEYCHAQTIASESKFSVPNFHNQPQLDRSSLCQVHGVRSYLGLPIITAAGDRLGTIAILDVKPRQFSERDSDLLQLLSRLVASEFERKLLSQTQLNRIVGDLNRSIPGFDDPLAASEYASVSGKPTAIELNSPSPSHKSPHDNPIPSSGYSQIQRELQSKLLAHLAQELRTPLTAVLGMASVLQQEIYGSLSGKQKDYLGIIHYSSQQLVTMVDEISQLGGFIDTANLDENIQQQQLTLKSVDLEMLCQLAIQSLQPLAQKKQQQILLDLTGDDLAPAPVTSGAADLWILDKDNVRQIIYYLCLSLIHASSVDARISSEFAHSADGLLIQLGTNDPHAILFHRDLPAPLKSGGENIIIPPWTDRSMQIGQDLRISLGLSLSHVLAASHGGKIEAISNGWGYQLPYR
jgi:signal transduction histidine kinase